jgi:hypothetical protein
MARYHNAIYSVMVENKDAIYSVERNAANTYNRDMTTRKKMQAREKILQAIRALPTSRARELWVERLGAVLYEMQK